MERHLSKPEKQLIFLIGAARSGTKIVRDVLSTHPMINAVPYDINFIWRTGNEKVLHDELIPNNYKEKSHRRIDKYLEKYRGNAPFLIEKTVSNTIRIPFLLKHYPNAKFIFLYRNGIDVIESVMRQWESSNDRDYLLAKLKHVPLKELFTYGIKYLFRNFSKNRSMFFWGVNYPELKDDLKSYPREVLVAYQWKYCVDKMLADKNNINSQMLFELKYEDFVLSAQKTIEELVQFIDPALDADEINLQKIRKDNIGKAQSALSSSQKELISSVIDRTMKQLDYK